MNVRRLCLLASFVILVVASSYGLTIAANEKDAETGGKEQAIGLKQLPDAVKATILTELLREVDGLKLEEISRETEGDKDVYEAEFEYNDKEIELEILADGKLLAKEVEVGDNEDGATDEKDEDD